MKNGVAPYRDSFNECHNLVISLIWVSAGSFLVSGVGRSLESGSNYRLEPTSVIEVKILYLI